ncbi:MAG TPA: hypothetical protein DIS53_00110 [Candidatus Wildermuthbacteria bacterium]|nr:MAG: hypothetical protein A2109_01915 [Candidatus Wildermuthbacteria bacterium GWA1_49_26]OHA65775.1 MAG: hypothetical protein A2674_03345 [Candidatus Wildermuthbacteria bacterium RIFCSPHIGHO2_01_FULL_50_47]OHA69678.1 MAG: hypothetical protein A3D63_03650 [Candidatus Wildermuthbacteria bacterium RIFCSPHIGHO2_02_FULL_49_17]OHA72604.1 MAG: hypothetical protein A3E08_00745 [Candidatus Wildermuthbacteria bacterium RIFCSPHIGHO2_12_FULL_49_13]OHA78003.1 MAG: hypothetical protein A3G10_02360 [Candi
MMVELIPKRERKPIFGQVFFLIVSLAVLASATAAFLILQQLIANAHEELGRLEKTLTEDTRPLEEELSSRLLGYRRKTEILQGVLDERKAILPFFEILETTTHPGVFFRTFQGNPKTGVFTLEGEAQSFFALEQQRLAWENREEFESKLRDIRLGAGGSSLFTVEFTVNPGFLDVL